MNEVEWTKIELFYGIGGEIPHTAELTVHEGQHLYRAHNPLLEKVYALLNGAPPMRRHL